MGHVGRSSRALHGTPGVGCQGPWAACVTLAQAADSPGQGAGRTACIVQGSLAEGLVQIGKTTATRPPPRAHQCP
jgi:hypothetical protein